jgi:hypothetical protein
MFVMTLSLNVIMFFAVRALVKIATNDTEQELVWGKIVVYYYVIRKLIDDFCGTTVLMSEKMNFVLIYLERANEGLYSH